jgi:adenylate cyclase
MASAHFLNGRRELCIKEASTTVALNPNSASEISGCGFLLAMASEWQEGLALLERGMRLNPRYPSWYHFVPFMDRYRQRAYQEAWVEAKRVNVPLLFWGPLIRAATLGQLGRSAEAQSALAELLQLKPDFASRATGLMQRLVFSDENVEMLLEGLRKAGLEMGIMWRGAVLRVSPRRRQDEAHG